STRLDSTTRVMFYPPGLDPHSVRAHFWETFTIDTIVERLKNKFEYDQAGALFDQDLAAQLKQIELKRQGLGQLEEFLNKYTELTYNLDTNNLEKIQKVLTFLEEHQASYEGIMDAAQVLYELSEMIKQGDLVKAKGKCQEIEKLIDQASSKFEELVGAEAIQKRYFEKKGKSELPNALAMRTLLEEHRYFSRLSA
ncbi:MAG: hypothetical protein KDK65_01305, partial [Chlamydiia bacterium]|nr:hypothetical protein [Chlamydiia bacterium]